MRFSKAELLQKIIAIIVIIIMTFADFAIIGMNAISYAIDMTVTNSNNVEFAAYFVDAENQQLTSIDSNINANDLKVYVEVSVKNEGYFNGQISLDNTSFRFNDKDTTNENEFVKEINENTIILNQINAGVTAKIEVGIEFRNEDNIELQYLNKDNQIKLTGIYKNSKKDVDIEGTTTVKVNWKSEEELNAKIGAKVLTNKVYQINENNKRIVQVLVNSKLENDVYPIKGTNIKLNVPEGAEEVKVHSRTTDATNGNTEFSVENYQYNSETGILEIDIQNNEKEGKISWLKDKKDSLIVTYIYPENISLEKQEINIENIITTYDEKQVSVNSKIFIEEEVDGVLTTDINLDETSIYKGKLYTGEDRYYTTTTVIDVNYALMDKVQIKENEALFTTKDDVKQSNIQYVQSKISKVDFDKIFGQDGYITILDQDGNTIANINKDTQIDDNGYINVNYNSGVKSIVINTSMPLVEHTLKIHHRKVILDNGYSREEIKEFTGIKEEVNNNHNSNSVATIDLKETIMQTELEVNKEALTTESKNEGVIIQTKLLTNGEDKQLYKNPIITVELPEEIEEVENAQVRIINGNGLEIKESKLKEVDGIKIITISLTGEQEKYSNEVLEGALIQLRFDGTLNQKIKNKEGIIKLEITNENTTDIVKNEASIKLINTISKNTLTHQSTATLETDAGVEIEQVVKATVGDTVLEDGAEVRVGEIIKYEITLTNKGNTDLKGIKVEGSVPEGTTRVVLEEVEETKLDYVEKEDRIVTFENLDIKKGENVILEYEVKVNTDITDNTQTTCKILTNYNDKNIETRLNNILKTGDFVIQLNKIQRKYEPLKSGYNYGYSLSITNISNTDKQNVKININKNDLLKIVSIMYTYNDEYYHYSKETLKDEVNINNIKAGDTILVNISTLVLEANDKLDKVEISTKLVENENSIYRSNKISEKVDTIQLSIEAKSSTDSDQQDNYVSSGDIIKYTIVVKNNGNIDANLLKINNKIVNYLTIKNVTLNGNKAQYSKNVSFDEDKSYTTISVDTPLKAGESCTIEIVATVNEITSSDSLEINNTVYAYNDICLKEVEGDIYYIKNRTSKLPDETNVSNDASTDSEEKEKEKAYKITGTVWYDQNEDGKKSENEQNLSAIQVHLLDVNSNAILTTTTNESGYYEFTDIKQGEYIVIFEYDTTNYIATAYKAEGVSAAQNSDGMQTKITLNGEEKTAAITDNIKLSEDVSNIDLGLTKAEKFDLELNKYVTKISVVNSKETKTYEFDKSELAKVEIDSKYLSSSTVIIEYVIEVKNTGEIAGYIQNIVDYKPTSLEFSSDLNKDWYQSGNNLYNKSLEKVQLNAGESKEISLILTKDMTESNTGLINNMAEIYKTDNTLGIDDIDSMSGNNQNGEDDLGSADVIISVKTGTALNYVMLLITVLVIFISAAYLINIKMLNRRIHI